MSELHNAMAVAASGLRVQSQRQRVIAENMANADSIPPQPGADPYRRKIISFQNYMDRRLGVEKVKVAGIEPEKGDFQLRYDPAHPAANEEGYVKVPNVNSMIEAIDSREAIRSYEANLMIMENSKSMIDQTISLIRRQ